MEILAIISLLLLEVGFCRSKNSVTMFALGLFSLAICAFLLLIMVRTNPSPSLLSFTHHIAPLISVSIIFFACIRRIRKSQNLIPGCVLLMLGFIIGSAVIAEPILFMRGHYARFHDIVGM